MARKKQEKVTSVSVDFSDTESNGIVPEGEWLATVKNVEVKTSENSGKDYLNWQLKTLKGSLWIITSLVPAALFNLRGLLEAMEVDVPDGPLDIDLEDMLGREFIAVVVHEKYKGKLQAKVSEYLPADGSSDSDDSDDESEDEVAINDEDSSELDKLSEEELGDMDMEEIEEVVEKYGLDIKLNKFKSVRKKLGAVIDALEEAGMLEED